MNFFKDEIIECETLYKKVEEDIKRHEAEKINEVMLKSLADEYLKNTPEDSECINIITGVIRDRDILPGQYDQLPPFMREIVIDAANNCIRNFLGAPLEAEPQRKMPNFQNKNPERST